MEIKQFYDDALAHASYLVISEGEAAVIDPERDPQPYLAYLREQQARLVAIIETHPHADFVSSHAELHRITGATIYNSRKLGAQYPHEGFDEGDELSLGGAKLLAFNTPGHSPDSITVEAIDEEGRPQAIFTGDTLFIGDVGRPDLRENAGNLTAQREQLAREMYRTTRRIFLPMESSLQVYPAHGAGSLCGKNLSDKLSSTLGEQKAENPNLQEMDEDRFVENLLEGQPHIPSYFENSVELNKQGAPDLEDSLARVPVLAPDAPLQDGVRVVDTRPADQFKQGHPYHAINIQEGSKFETWLGSLVDPREPYYLVAADEDTAERLLRRAAKIGYELNCRGVQATHGGPESVPKLDLERFHENPGEFTIVDVRAESEGPNVFPSAYRIPLEQLEERADEIDTRKPIVVHCAAGYRSAAGSSILHQALKEREAEVYDLGEAIEAYLNTAQV
jgi:glyoxylase-like metal-dependent hydrolase (beta-lactamase superfamily II)/rhodanese-related sulfurtransferase